MRMDTSEAWPLAVALSGALLFCAVGCSPRGESPDNHSPSASESPTSRVTFVQWTDLHLFDAGAARGGARGHYAEAVSNRAGLAWAVLETNRLASRIDGHVDFVAITGDFGLANVQLPNTVPGHNCDCPPAIGGDGRAIAPVSLESAAREFGAAIRGLIVKRVYLVPGDADLCNARHDDSHRWAEFVHALQVELRNDAIEIVDLTFSFERLAKEKHPRIVPLLQSGKTVDLPSTPRVNGFSLIGMNTGFFVAAKNGDERSTAYTAALKEVERVSAALTTAGESIVFTHVPDVSLEPPKVDERETHWPFGISAPDVSKAAPALLKRWSTAIRDRRSVIGVFGGHSHQPQRGQYPVRWESADEPGAQSPRWKTWWSPPIAVTGQPEGAIEHARGMLLVSVGADGKVNMPTAVDGGKAAAQPVWFKPYGDEPDDNESLASLYAGGEAERDRDWTRAVDAYGKSRASPNANIRSASEAGLLRVRPHATGLFWHVGQSLPPVRWIIQYPAFGYALLGVLVVGVWRRLRRGRVVLLSAEVLDAETPGISKTWFDRELALAYDEVIDRLRREANEHHIGGALGGFAITPSVDTMSAAADALGALVPVAGADGVAKVLVELWQKFGRIVVTTIGTLPTSSAGNAGTTFLAFTTSRVLWVRRGSWRDTATPAENVPVLARRVAARLVGTWYVRQGGRRGNA